MTDLNGDLRQRTVVDTAAMTWTASPSRTVHRKRVHLVGAAESGQVTSIVRYEPGATFPSHGHPQGEEILVLAGVFSDEHGDWPAGTYLLNPEGFRHAPRSADGCTLFVKLRQYPGTDRRQLALATDAVQWTCADMPGVQTKLLYAQDGYTDRMRLECWDASAAEWAAGWAAREYPEGAEILVLDGTFTDEQGEYREGTWLRMPSRSAHCPRPDPATGCTVYIKEGGFAYLRTSNA